MGRHRFLPVGDSRSRKVPSRRVVCLTVVVAALVALAAPVSSSRVAGATATSVPDPTLQQLKADVATSVEITSSPNLATTIPPILSLTAQDGSLVPQRTQCYSGDSTTTVPLDAMTACAYGDLRAKTFVLLTGDSQAGMWLPALNQIALQLQLKIVFLAKAGCGPWGNPNPPNFVIWKDVTVADCTSYIASVARWAVSHKPLAVVLDGRGYPLGATISNPPVLSTLEAEMASESARLAPSKATLIVISPIPRYEPDVTAWFPNTCLGYAHPITQCEYAPSFLIPRHEMRAEIVESHLGAFTLANITPLFCTPSRCALFVNDRAGSHLVYDNDGAHINRFFSTWVSSALRPIIEPLLLKGTGR